MFLNRMEDWAMKYNGFYFWMFKGPMKKVLAKKYGKAYVLDRSTPYRGTGRSTCASRRTTRT